MRTLFILAFCAATASAQAVVPASAVRQFDSVYKSLRTAPKDEFETSAAFAARTSAALDSSLFAVAIRLGDSTEANIRYDADSAEFRLYVWGEEARGPDFLKRFCGVLANSVVKAVGQYEGSNAFGVKRTVTRKSIQRDVLASSREIGLLCSVTSLGAPMSAEAARQIKPHLRAYAVGRVTTGPSGVAREEQGDLSEATITAPTEEIITRRIVWVKDLAIVLVDGRTGQVLARQTSEEAFGAPWKR